MALDKRIHRVAKGVHIKRSLKAHGKRDVISCAVWFELIQKPQTLLGKRKRRRVVRCSSGNRVGFRVACTLLLQFPFE